MAHSRLSPSGWDKAIACPGSVKAEAPFPNTDSRASLHGTQAHALLEVCLEEQSATAKKAAAEAVKPCTDDLNALRRTFTDVVAERDAWRLTTWIAGGVAIIASIALEIMMFAK